MTGSHGRLHGRVAGLDPAVEIQRPKPSIVSRKGMAGPSASVRCPWIGTRKRNQSMRMIRAGQCRSEGVAPVFPDDLARGGQARP